MVADLTSCVSTSCIPLGIGRDERGVSGNLFSTQSSALSTSLWGRIEYTVWSEVFTCPDCAGDVVFLEQALAPKTKRVKDSFPCRHCGAELDKRTTDAHGYTQMEFLNEESEPIRVNPWFNSWRAEILKEFTAGVARLTLVADPDGLLLEEGVLEGIRERGFELIPFEDHVAFRYAYESKFRSRWDRGEETDLVVVLRSPSSDLDALPYDLLQAGRKLSFNLGKLFPNLSYPVVAVLDRSCLDTLFGA